MAARLKAAMNAMSVLKLFIERKTYTAKGRPGKKLHREQRVRVSLSGELLTLARSLARTRAILTNLVHNSARCLMSASNSSVVAICHSITLVTHGALYKRGSHSLSLSVPSW